MYIYALSLRTSTLFRRVHLCPLSCTSTPFHHVHPCFSSHAFMLFHRVHLCPFVTYIYAFSSCTSMPFRCMHQCFSLHAFMPFRSMHPHLSLHVFMPFVMCIHTFSSCAFMLCISPTNPAFITLPIYLAFHTSYWSHLSSTTPDQHALPPPHY